MTRHLRRRSSSAGSAASAASAALEPLELDEPAGEGDADADAEYRLGGGGPRAAGGTAVDARAASGAARAARLRQAPPPRYHTVKYAGVLASASRWRARIAPSPKPVADGCSSCTAPPVDEPSPAKKKKAGPNTYRAWADLLRRTFAVDVLECPTCKGRLKLVAMVTEHASITRFLEGLGEPTSVPARSPARGPPYWRSTVLRRKALGHVA